MFLIENAFTNFSINGKVKQFKGPLSIILNLRCAIIEITVDETFLRSTSLCNFLTRLSPVVMNVNGVEHEEKDIHLANLMLSFPSSLRINFRRKMWMKAEKFSCNLYPLTIFTFTNPQNPLVNIENDLLWENLGNYFVFKVKFSWKFSSHLHNETLRKLHKFFMQQS